MTPARDWLACVRRAVRTLFAPPTRVVSGDDEPDYRPIDWRLIRRLLAWLAPYRKRYALGISLGVVMVVLEMQSPRFMQAIIDVTVAAAADARPDHPATPAAPPTLPDATRRDAVQRILQLVALWALTLGTAVVIHRFTILIMCDAGERVQFDIRRALFRHLQSLSMSYFDKTRLGRIVSRCTSDVNSLRDVNVWGIDTLVKNAVMMLVAGFMLARTDLRLFAAVAWLAPLLYVANLVYRRRIGAAYQLAREAYTRVAANLAENITGVRVVTAFHRQDWNISVFNALQSANTDRNVAAARVNAIYQPLLQLIGAAGRITILLYGGYLVAAGRFPAGIGAVVAAFLYWDWFMNPVIAFGNFHNQLMMAMAGGERILNLLDLKPEFADRPDAQPIPRIVGRVEFQNVTFGYDPARPVLHDLSFVAQPGQMIALVGHTGCGKTSVISLLARFYQPQSGRILIDGVDVAHVTGESLHRQMGLVLQVNYLFTGTVLDNIRYARPDARDDDVYAATRALGCYDALAGMDQGFLTQVGERGANISLGQRQLICFARAYLADPRIFMLDEATSAIDTATELVVHRSLMKLRQGRTTFVVAHRLSTILRADCILVLEHGRIVERGSHRALVAAGGLYARLWDQFVFNSR